MRVVVIENWQPQRARMPARFGIGHVTRSVDIGRCDESAGIDPVRVSRHGHEAVTPP
jgi:predicted secreted protein